MSRDLLGLLQQRNAFNATPLTRQLAELHVPFDDLAGERVCEAPVEAAIRRGERVALVGTSGAGKSSVIAHVLGPLVEGVAPIPVPVAAEPAGVASDPVAFGRHLLRSSRIFSSVLATQTWRVEPSCS